MAKIDIRGLLIPNDYKWFYDAFRIEATCPKDVQDILDKTAPGEDIEVYINSPGGVIDVGSEIYTLLRDAARKGNIKIYITGEACSAASVIAMAGYCEMSPTALMMVHCVSTSASGNHGVMEHTSELLRTADNALCTAYMQKAGMGREEALDMMEKETWLTAEQAVQRKLVDKIMFERQKKPILAAGPLFELPGEEQLERARQMLRADGDKPPVSLLQQKLKFLRLKGEK